jgi:hypothetical protein
MPVTVIEYSISLNLAAAVLASFSMPCRPFSACFFGMRITSMALSSKGTLFSDVDRIAPQRLTWSYAAVCRQDLRQSICERLVVYSYFD